MGQGFGISMTAADRAKFAKDIANFASKAEKSVSESVARVAAFTAAEAKKLVPVDKGILRNSIRTEEKDQFTWEVATNSGYGLYIEFGEPQGTGPNGGPRPFLRPGFERGKQRVFTELRRNFKK